MGLAMPFLDSPNTTNPVFSVIKVVTPFYREIENNTSEVMQKAWKSAKRVKSSANVGQPTGTFSIDSGKGSLLMINRRR